jgi:hypothetical protein
MKTKRFCLTELAKLKSSLQQVEANATPNLLRGCRKFIRAKIIETVYYLFLQLIPEINIHNTSFEPHETS